MLLQLSPERGTFSRSERNFLKDVTLVGQDLGRFVSTICPDIRSPTAVNPAKRRTGPEVRHCCPFTHSFILARLVCSTSTSGAPAMCLPLETDMSPLSEKSLSHGRPGYEEYVYARQREKPRIRVNDHCSLNEARTSLSPTSGLTGPQSPFTTSRGHHRVTLRL